MLEKILKFQKTIFGCLRLLFYLALLTAFIIPLSRTSTGLTRLSRTLLVAILTFTVTGLLLIAVYGKYDIGRRKSREIINSFLLSTLLTDIVTYLQLMIMRVNNPEIKKFAFIGFGYLLLAYLIQIVLIIIFVKFGDYLYFKLNKPENCCLITASQEDVNKFMYSAAKYAKRYRITAVYDWRAFTSKDAAQLLLNWDTFFLYNIPTEIKSKLMQLCYGYKKNVYFNPEIDDVMTLNANRCILSDIHLLQKNVKSITMEQRVVKRAADIVFSLLLGIITLPILLAAMIAIKCEDGGPVIFKQKRVTVNSRIFTICKLRTMKVNNENYATLKDDERITKVGRYLRKFRIDELPQLYNILKGDMSFVGPRAEMIANVAKYEKEFPEFAYRFRVKAGLTGIAQIYGKYNTPCKDKLLLDMMYIEEFSLLKDLQIILQTPSVFLKSDSTEGFFTEFPASSLRFVKWVDDEKKSA